jgi:hypothetical protein
MLVSETQFIYYVTKYKEAYEEKHRFHDALRPFFDFPICNYQDELFNAYESLLIAISECYDEKTDIFYWWVSEHPNDDKIIRVKQPNGEKVEYDVATAGGLYRYLYDMYHHDD